MQDFVNGWFDAISVMKEDPQGTNKIIGDSLKLSVDDVSGMLSGLKLTGFADNAQFFDFVLKIKSGEAGLSERLGHAAEGALYAAVAERFLDQGLPAK